MNLQLLLVTFSLRNPQRDYNDFFVALRGNATNWWHFIEQTAVVSTHHSSHEFARLLIPTIETTDSLLVSEIDVATCQGWLPPQAWKWFREVSQARHLEELRNLLPRPLGKP
jgi:hypothetical protein